MKRQTKSMPGGRSLLTAILQSLLVLAIAVGVGQGLIIPLFQSQLFESVQRWEVEYLNSGTIDLVAAELNDGPSDEMQGRLNELATRFGFDVSLTTLSDTAVGRLDAENMARLQNFEAVGDPSDYSLFMLLANRKDVLVFSNTKIPASHFPTEAQRRNIGTITMLQRALESEPPQDWAAAIESHAESFQYPVALVATSDLSLERSQLAELNAGLVVTVETEDSVTADYPAEWVYKKINEQVLVLGPFSPPTLKRFYPVVATYYVVLGLIVLLPLGLWLAPTWRSLNQLSRATSAFGQGDFAARAGSIRGSKCNHLIDVFNQMAGKIQSLVESNKALINAVSHELRTPISRIEFNIELARQSTDIDERNKQLGRIESSVDELKTMVSEMLQYARFDREKPNFSMESVNVHDWLVGESKNWQVDGAANGDVRIRIAVPDRNIQATIERYYMSRAISNLVRNATRFAKSTVIVSASVTNGSCAISVADDGPGVEYQERTKIFEPFVRLDQSRNRESGGTGLGLAIVKQIAVWHSGDVWVEESASGGAKFVVQWPQHDKV